MWSCTTSLSHTGQERIPACWFKDDPHTQDRYLKSSSTLTFLQATATRQPAPHSPVEFLTHHHVHLPPPPLPGNPRHATLFLPSTLHRHTPSFRIKLHIANNSLRNSHVLPHPRPRDTASTQRGPSCHAETEPSCTITYQPHFASCDCSACCHEPQRRMVMAICAISQRLYVCCVACCVYGLECMS